MPASVIDVRGLLQWLRGRGGTWERALAEDVVRVTVNKQFAAPATPVKNSDEIAIVSARPF